MATLKKMNRRNFIKGLTAAALAAPALTHGQVPQAGRPNILWITAEDISPNLACYGDPNAVTPNLDRFAKRSLRFTNVFSVHPCCSPSRSCLVTGVYPTRLGTFQHRARIAGVPAAVRTFPSLLREAGYVCFNGSKGGSFKTDYNYQPQDQPWDKTQSKAVEWRNRKAGQPFFGQINLACTHQSQYGLAAPGSVDHSTSHDPARIHLPPYHPDTPAVREIWAEYHDRISQMDKQFGELMQMLATDGLTEETIVFFFGDNGQGIPGGKVWLWDQGLHVPLIVHLPKKWAYLAAAVPGSTCDQLVSFLDFAPTVLTLAGVAVPAAMQGAPFLGPQAHERRYCFAARDFHDGSDFDTSRAVRDRRYHYIRNFMPQQGWDAILYSWGQAPHMLEEWRAQAAAGKLKAGTRQACFFRRTKPAEELYDMQGDPWQMRSVAADPQYREVLEKMRAECERWMIENRDLGLLSQYELYTRSEKDTPFEMGADAVRNAVKRLLAAANAANHATPESIPQLLELLKADDGAVRRWGALGLLTLREAAAPATGALLAALKDPAPDVRLSAAEALCGLGRSSEAMAVLIEALGHDSRIIRNETLLVLSRIGEPARAALPHLNKALPPCKHMGLWSSDNIPDAIALVQACLGVPAQTTAQSPPFDLKKSRQKYLP